MDLVAPGSAIETCRLHGFFPRQERDGFMVKHCGLRLAQLASSAVFLVALSACGGYSEPPSGDPVHRWGYIDLPDGSRMRYSVSLPHATGSYPVLIEYDGYSSG